mgnify:CR=1 FL=1|tara:strand:+ start:282 stop:542 length:261 start_codon:yes stop_codon:yes gene_type:complete
MTDDENNAAARAFMELIEANAPPNLTGEHLVNITGMIMTMYAKDMNEAGTWIMALARGVRHYYEIEESGGECVCPRCTAARKAKAH